MEYKRLKQFIGIAFFNHIETEEFIERYKNL